MVSYFVSYRGDSPDPEAVLRHYAERHSPLLAQFPGICSLDMHTAIEWRDPFKVNPAGLLLLAQMRFDSIEALNVALASAARARAREDFSSFPAFDGVVTHQAMLSHRMF